MLSVYPSLKNVVITSFPTLNNSGDRIVLLDSLGRAIDSLEYKSAWGGSGGKSLERYDVFGASTDSLNWKTSLVEKGGTPGKVNSVSKKNFDAAVSEMSFSPVNPDFGQDVSIKAKAVNNGKNSIDIKLMLFEINFDSTRSKIEESQLIRITPGKEVEYKFGYKIISINSKHTFEVELNSPEDEDQSNNKITLAVLPGYMTNAVRINEIMFAPLNGEPEWIELFNSSDSEIDLTDWSITDVLPKPATTKLKRISIPPKTFIVISKDSSILNYHNNIPSGLLVNSFPPLNNDADGVVIKDPHDITIDSMSYDKSWGGNSGRSIERKTLTGSVNDKSNWASSRDVELSTPDRINSVTQKSYDLALTGLKMNPEKPSFDDDVKFTTVIKNVGLEPAQNFYISFFFLNGTDTALFYSVDKNGLNVSDSIEVDSGPGIKLTSAKTILCRINYSKDQDTSNNSIAKVFEAGYRAKDVLISEIMYSPLDGESEWIEIVNNSQNSVNLKGWTASDLVSPIRSAITNGEAVLLPGEFAVLTQDTSKFLFYPPKDFFQVKFGALGNTYDGFVIHDNRDVLIDSVEYKSNWGGRKGFSLERISIGGSSTDSTNWSTSLNPDGATPGDINSLSGIPSYQNNAMIINEIMYDPSPGNSEFLEFFNQGNDTIQIGGMILIMGISKRIELSSTLFVVPPKCFFIVAADSSIYDNYKWLKEEEFYVMINNSLSLSNDGTIILLKDMYGNKIDSLSYSPLWHNENLAVTKNRSLERLSPVLDSNDPGNWSSSVGSDYATPGKQNSVYVESLPGEAKVTINPNPFSPDNDGFEDFTAININLTKRLSQVRIRVFDSVGRLVRTIAQNMPSSSKSTIIFNGLDDNGRALRIGIYILLIEAVADDGSTETIKTPVVVARRL